MTAARQRIRVLVVDDHAVVRGGLRTFLDAFDDFELVGEAENGEEAIRACVDTRADVVLMSAGPAPHPPSASGGAHGTPPP